MLRLHDDAIAAVPVKALTTRYRRCPVVQLTLRCLSAIRLSAIRLSAIRLSAIRLSAGRLDVRRVSDA